MGKIAKFFLASPENNYHPPVLSFKAFLIYGLILLLLRLFLGTLPAKSAAVDGATLMGLLNQERSNRNLPVLYTHQSLLRAAGEKSQDMIDRDYFAHIDPDGNYVWGRIVAAGYAPYKILGENLAVDFATSEGMIKAWIDSPTHRANILHPDFVDQGLVALFGDYQGRYTNLTTSLFGTLATAVAKAPAAPPASPPPKPPPASPKPPTPPAGSQSPSSATVAKNQPPQNISLPREARGEKTPSTSPIAFPKPNLASNFQASLKFSRTIFTIFGILLLLILVTDTVIIYRLKPQEPQLMRSYSSYHLVGFMLIVLVSILIWWW